MPNQQSKDVKLIPVQMKQTFIDRIDANLDKMGYAGRSEFIRDAIREALERRNIPTESGEHLAPSRLRYPEHVDTGAALNDAPPPTPKIQGVSSTVADALAKGPVPNVSKAESSTKSSPSRGAGATSGSKHGRPQGIEGEKTPRRVVPKPVPAKS